MAELNIDPRAVRAVMRRRPPKSERGPALEKKIAR
jgi:hypothetical protein